ncbi:MAG TPA: bifunctional pyr operon transcriptional regulator/uracil phosphoribosyltransferase PyrR [Candidatus Eisenbacteria bacterium]|nr:bifunctional pyr operon transcriptional regulator/uracil phosphoribosyltransferase PyrR [Candidatus Eisenbacteria bacterium]
MDKLILDAPSLERSVTRMAHEILEKNKGTEGLVLVGIQTRGVTLAARLGASIESIAGARVPSGVLDINLYRDDLTHAAEQPVIHKTEIACDLENRIVVLVDDVLYTGRTIRCALDALLVDFGRPRRIELAVLVDRGHRELPIRADFVGKNIPTSEDELVHVHFKETDGKDEVVVTPKHSRGR